VHLTAVYLQNEPPASSFVKEDVAVDTDGHFSPARKKMQTSAGTLPG